MYEVDVQVEMQGPYFIVRVSMLDHHYMERCEMLDQVNGATEVENNINIEITLWAD